MNTRDRIKELLDTAYRALGEAVVLAETQGSDMGEFHKEMITRLAERISEVRNSANDQYFDKTRLVGDLQKEIKHHFSCLTSDPVLHKEVKTIYTSVAKHREQQGKKAERLEKEASMLLELEELGI